MAKTYTVKWGDTLWGIAHEYNTTVAKLSAINNIALTTKNGQQYALITVGQVIKLEDDGSSTTAKKVTSGAVKITNYGLQSGSAQASEARGMYVTWSWDRENTAGYDVVWYEYYDGYWHQTNYDDVTVKYSEFTAKSQATSVKVKIKPISKTYTNSKNKQVSYWTNVQWITSSTYAFKNNPPSVPSAELTVEIANRTKLKVSMEDDYDFSSLNASIIEFQLSKNGVATTNKRKASIGSNMNTVGTEFTVELSSKYKVRARAIRGSMSSAWGAWSGEVSTPPSAPVINTCMPTSKDDGVDLAWTPVTTATSYIIQYTKNQEKFTNSDAKEELYTYEVKASDLESGTCKLTITNSDIFKENVYYYFRIQAVSGTGENDKSEWSNIAYMATGNGPKAPSTFSSASTITVGKSVTLNWTHQNTGDDSKTLAKYSHIDLYVDGVRKLVETVTHDISAGYKDDSDHQKSKTITTAVDQSEHDRFHIYIDNLDIVCSGGADIRWRVRTATETGQLGEWSILRTIKVYADPKLDVNAHNPDGDSLTTPDNKTFQLTSLPLCLIGDVNIESTKQQIIGYHIEIVADSTYEAINNQGESVNIREGEIIYSKTLDYFEPIDSADPNRFSIDISAGDATFVTDAVYKLICSVTMDSGLSTSQELIFSTVLAETEYILDAEITIDTDNYSAMIRPYCSDARGQDAIENVNLAIYRREYDGTFTLISDGINNATMVETYPGSGRYMNAFTNVFVTDPHPALDYARYRIVATDLTTNTTYYSDVPAVSVKCKSIIIQWDENWSSFDATDSPEDVVAWDGEMLKLPFNIDITNKYDPDVALVEYVGREHPVDYYGTHRRESATWNVTIDKDDQETIYSLYRLAKWMGSVYVREPSGVGYWANIKVSFGRKHRDLTIPVSLEITRVEGGK